IGPAARYPDSVRVVAGGQHVVVSDHFRAVVGRKPVADRLAKRARPDPEMKRVTVASRRLRQTRLRKHVEPRNPPDTASQRASTDFRSITAPSPARHASTIHPGIQSPGLHVLSRLQLAWSMRRGVRSRRDAAEVSRPETRAAILAGCRSHFAHAARLGNPFDDIAAHA